MSTTLLFVCSAQITLIGFKQSETAFIWDKLLTYRKYMTCFGIDFEYILNKCLLCSSYSPLKGNRCPYEKKYIFLEINTFFWRFAAATNIFGVSQLQVNISIKHGMSLFIYVYVYVYVYRLGKSIY